VRQRPGVEALLEGGVGVRGAPALACLGVSAIMIVVAGYWLFRALRPRLLNHEPSRFAFPHPASGDLKTLAEPHSRRGPSRSLDSSRRRAGAGPANSLRPCLSPRSARPRVFRRCLLRSDYRIHSCR
jgi:hypothetical protein